MAHPQIAAFARLADGNAKPTRAIAGQNSLLTRTIHGIAYDPLSDEIVVPQFYAQAVMIFRGGADGDEAPIRVIGGPDTQLKNPNHLDVDPVHKEIFVPLADRVLVFPSGASGNVTPTRVLKRPDAVNGDYYSLVVDPVHDLLIVAVNPTERSGGTGSIGKSPWSVLIFNRTDAGNVKPRAVIGGPNSRISSGLHIPSLAVYPPRELFFAVLDTNQRFSPDNFVGVWSERDNGDVPPRWTIGGPNGMLRDAKGLAIDPKSKSVFVTDKYLNSILTFYFPEIF